MPVIFSGGPSGNRQDGLPPVPSSGASQPVLDTSGGGGGSNIQWCQNTANREGLAPPPVPGGATFPTSGTDIADPTATTGGDESVFKGAPDTGHE